MLNEGCSVRGKVGSSLDFDECSSDICMIPNSHSFPLIMGSFIWYIRTKKEGVMQKHTFFVQGGGGLTHPNTYANYSGN